jgi:protein tyrosine phosphatase (PTP) superfamily phosphohydrolase (DUF442 family)
MSTRLCWSFVVTLAGLWCVAGCCHLGGTCCPPGPRLSAYPFNPCQPRYVSPGPPVPFQAGPVPGCCPAAPPARPMPPGPPAAPPGFEPAPSWRPSLDPGVRLDIPQPAAPQAPPDSLRLSPPVPAQPPTANEPPMAPNAGVKEGPTTPTPPLPVGIPQFAMAKNRVASGLRPMIEGIDWLKANGYRTVLHVRAPGQDDAADRKQFEMRGLKYVSLELSPESLTREVVDQFNHLVTDPANQPLFVYDRDGVLAGGLWYLHFRTSEQLADDAARVRSGALGLREDQDGAHRTMWLAIQKYLSDRPR